MNAKTILILTTVSLFIGCSNAQEINEKDVPSAVKENFTKSYPDAKNVEWIKEEDGYEAEFIINKTESSATYDNDGKFKELELEIKIKELPAAASEYCTVNYADHKLSEAAKITDDAGKISFEAELTKGGEHFDIIFDAEGNFIKKTETKKNEGEEKD